MTSLFQFIMYMLLGKHWIKWDMVQGYKMAIFVNEAEIEMERMKVQDATERHEKLQKDMVALEASPLTDPLTLLDPSLHEDKREVEKMLFKIKEERKEQLLTFKNQIKSASNDIQIADGALQKIYSITYSTRRKYDYMKNYKIVDTYADKNK